jgi:hypothetical protein
MNPIKAVSKYPLVTYTEIASAGVSFIIWTISAIGGEEY